MSSDAFTRLEIPRLSGPSLTQERDRARARGHAAGYAEGMRLAAAHAERDAAERAEREHAADAAARARVAAAVAALERAAARFDARAAELTAPVVAGLHAMAIELAQAIVERELSDPVRAALTTAARVENAVADGEAAEPPVVRLSAADVDVVASALTGTLPRSVTIEVDPGLAPGDATIRLADGAIDLRIATAFARARRALEDSA
ncbi:FliH/SctL family protein [Microbacterium arborescens]|uniref:FliH/SctL family protein n=1 Tax=Microbacterium arborescens TaxID=33883 RepID=UPI00277DAD40|nr:FliH/SctL family protein [Microbacterium arborescens]MDQ1217885.1 flagellar assembly protein FliH [Microbacterium arborescens]